MYRNTDYVGCFENGRICAASRLAALASCVDGAVTKKQNTFWRRSPEAISPIIVALRDTHSGLSLIFWVLSKSVHLWENYCRKPSLGRQSQCSMHFQPTIICGCNVNYRTLAKALLGVAIRVYTKQYGISLSVSVSKLVIQQFDICWQ